MLELLPPAAAAGGKNEATNSVCFRAVPRRNGGLGDTRMATPGKL